MNISLGKAGRKRWMGRKPHNRGTSQNPVNHPMGGGEGRSKGGRHPCSPRGVLAKGGKTRKKRKPSNKAIVRRRSLARITRPFELLTENRSCPLHRFGEGSRRGFRIGLAIGFGIYILICSQIFGRESWRQAG